MSATTARTCPVCGKTFGSNLNRHIRTIHKTEPPPTDYSGRVRRAWEKRERGTKERDERAAAAARRVERAAVRADWERAHEADVAARRAAREAKRAAWQAEREAREAAKAERTPRISAPRAKRETTPKPAAKPKTARLSRPVAAALRAVKDAQRKGAPARDVDGLMLRLIREHRADWIVSHPHIALRVEWEVPEA